MGHIRDRWTDPSQSGRRVRNERWGVGRRWQARWTEDGREHAKTFAAKDAAQLWLSEKDLGIVRRAGRTITLQEMAVRWQNAQAHHRPSTRATVDVALSSIILPTLGDRMVGDLSRHDLQAAVNEWTGRWAPSRVRIAWSFVGSMLKMAEADGIIEKAPQGIRLPAITRAPIVPLTLDQVARITDAMPAHWRTLVTVGAASGLRSGELRGLTWDRCRDGVLVVDRQLVDADGVCPVFGPPKSSAGVRRVRIGATAQQALEEQLAGWPSDDLVWRSRLGTPLTRKAAGEAWREVTRDMGLRPRSGLHDLRHFHASLLISSGLSVRAVADRLGHADPSETLRTYAHLWPSDEERAVDAVEAALGVSASGTDTRRTKPEKMP